MADDGVQPKEGRSRWKAASVRFASFVTNKLHGTKMKKVQKKCSLYNCFPGDPTYLGTVFVNLQPSAADLSSAEECRPTSAGTGCLCAGMSE